MAELGRVLSGTRQVQVQTHRPLVSVSELLGSSMQDQTCMQVAAGSGRADLPGQGHCSVAGEALDDSGHQAATPSRSFPSACPAQTAFWDHRSGYEQYGSEVSGSCPRRLSSSCTDENALTVNIAVTPFSNSIETT